MEIKHYLILLTFLSVALTGAFLFLRVLLGWTLSSIFIVFGIGVIFVAASIALYLKSAKSDD